MTNEQLQQVRQALIDSIEFIYEEYRDYQAEINGEFLAPEARPIYETLCDAFQILAEDNEQ